LFELEEVRGCSEHVTAFSALTRSLDAQFPLTLTPLALAWDFES
jgi:hypothetical protein